LIKDVALIECRKGDGEGEGIITHGKAMCTEVYFKVLKSFPVLIQRKVFVMLMN
jgi:hypothetical protein